VAARFGYNSRKSGSIQSLTTGGIFTPEGEVRKAVNWNETMTVKLYEYHDLIKENEKLKQRVEQLEEEIARKKSTEQSSSRGNTVEPVA
jgi:hypothetical protein